MSDKVVVFGRTPEKLAKIGEQFGFAATIDLDALITDPSVDLVDVCLTTRLHTDVAVRASCVPAGMCSSSGPWPTASMPPAGSSRPGRPPAGRAFVDMFSRFTAAHPQLRNAVADQRYGSLILILILMEGGGAPRCSGRATTSRWRPWPLTRCTLTATWSAACSADSRPSTSLPPPVRLVTAGPPPFYSTTPRRPPGSAAVRSCRSPTECAAASAPPSPTQSWNTHISAGSTGQGPATLTERTAAGERPIDLTDLSPCAAMIDHVLACLAGRVDNRIDPTSTVAALEFTLGIDQRLSQPAA